MDLKPAALAKAESLYKFALSQGAKPVDYQLALTTAEGIEILDWFVNQHENNELLLEDVEAAKVKNDPWDVLQFFNLMGFSMTPVESMH